MPSSGAGRLVIEVDGAGGAELRHGRLHHAWGLEAPTDRLDSRLPFDDPPAADGGPGDPASAPAPTAVPRELADELTCVAAWLDAQAGRVRLLSAEHGLASSLPRVPTFTPRRPPLPDRHR